MELNEWVGRCADSGTSGDMVYDILHDWRVERDKLIVEIKQHISEKIQLQAELEKVSTAWFDLVQSNNAEFKRLHGYITELRAEIERLKVKNASLTIRDDFGI